MFNKFRVKISDFFNRLPAGILIPLVLLVAFGIAALFIWAGIEMSPVTERVAEDWLTDKPTTQDNQDKNDDSDQSGNILKIPEEEGIGSVGSSIRSESEGISSSIYPSGLDDSATSPHLRGGKESSFSPSNEGEAREGVDDTENTGGDGFRYGDLNQQGSSLSTSGDEQENTNQNQNNSTSQGASQPSGSGGQSGSNSNSNQNGSDGGTQEECYHPPGDVRKWWHNATPKQKECYISQHGMPNLGQQVPYFCDYNNSEDCYYR